MQAQIKVLLIIFEALSYWRPSSGLPLSELISSHLKNCKIRRFNFATKRSFHVGTSKNPISYLIPTHLWVQRRTREVVKSLSLADFYLSCFWDEELFWDHKICSQYPTVNSCSWALTMGANCLTVSNDRTKTHYILIHYYFGIIIIIPSIYSGLVFISKKYC